MTGLNKKLYRLFCISGKVRVKYGFTLAEVLITLGIIGIVATITIPTLVTTAQKKSTAMKVKAFYSKINQVVRLSIVDNEEPEGWTMPTPWTSYPAHLSFVNKYFAPYMKLSACKNIRFGGMPGCIACAMNNGGAVVWGYTPDGLDIYYVTDYDVVLQNIKNSSDIRKDLRHTFAFQLNKINAVNYQPGIIKDSNIRTPNYVVPYTLNWDGNLETLKTQSRYGCSKTAQYPSFCTKLIQENGWEIPKDYPW